ncbi:MAG TPA: hypothetical protein VI197_21715 [Polyangiaceae bacterium]
MNTETLILRRALGYARPEEYVEWALALLCADIDGPNLRILAGLNLRIERDDVEEYFLATCRELGVPADSVNADAPLPTAKLVQEAFCRGDVSAAEAIRMMADLYRRSEQREALLSPWMWLRLTLDSDRARWSSTEALAALEDTVRREYSLLERSLAVPLPRGWMRHSWCRDCNHVGELALVPATLVDRFLRLVGARSATDSIVCASCGSRNHRSLCEREVHLEYLDYVEGAARGRAAEEHA